MGKIKHYIDMIVEGENQEYMECLSDMLSEIIYDMKEEHHDMYNKYKKKLFGMAHNYRFDEELAKEIVSDMKPIGEMWNYDTVVSVKKQYGINDIETPELYIVLNSLANDYKDVINTDDVETYIAMAKAFIKDEDAINNKVWYYFTTIPKED